MVLSPVGIPRIPQESRLICMGRSGDQARSIFYLKRQESSSKLSFNSHIIGAWYHNGIISLAIVSGTSAGLINFSDPPGFISSHFSRVQRLCFRVTMWLPRCTHQAGGSFSGTTKSWLCCYIFTITMPKSILVAIEKTCFISLGSRTYLHAF